MKRLSYSQRLVVGLGTIALGVCAALPFRRTTDMADVNPVVASDSGLAFSADVALQLPGSPSVADEFPSALWEDDAATQDSGETAGDHVGSRLEMVPLPSMPDHFQPLQQQAPVASSPVGVIVEPPQLPQAVKKERHHKIRDGDTLESLALRYLDDEGRANEIFAANRAILKDPKLLPIGAELTIPDDNRKRTSTASAELVPLPGRSSGKAQDDVRFRSDRHRSDALLQRSGAVGPRVPVGGLDQAFINENGNGLRDTETTSVQ